MKNVKNTRHTLTQQQPTSSQAQGTLHAVVLPVPKHFEHVLLGHQAREGRSVSCRGLRVEQPKHASDWKLLQQPRRLL